MVVSVAATEIRKVPTPGTNRLAVPDSYVIRGTRYRNPHNAKVHTDHRRVSVTDGRWGDRGGAQGNEAVQGVKVIVVAVLDPAWAWEAAAVVGNKHDERWKDVVGRAGGGSAAAPDGPYDCKLRRSGRPSQTERLALAAARRTAEGQ